MDKSQHPINNLVEAHCYGIGRTGQIFEQSRSSAETDRNVDVSTAKVFVSTMLTKTFIDIMYVHRYVCMYILYISVSV